MEIELRPVKRTMKKYKIWMWYNKVDTKKREFGER